ncbi:hypothetical protein KJ616_00730 [Patescibacteria group bacterium]|nr:hypothetical protein [Patescibacteria group bacterium]
MKERLAILGIGLGIVMVGFGLALIVIRLGQNSSFPLLGTVLTVLGLIITSVSVHLKP